MVTIKPDGTIAADSFITEYTMERGFNDTPVMVMKDSDGNTIRAYGCLPHLSAPGRRDAEPLSNRLKAFGVWLWKVMCFGTVEGYDYYH